MFPETALCLSLLQPESGAVLAPGTLGPSGLPHFQVFFWNSRGDWQSKPWGFPCLRANQGCWWMSQGNPTWIFCTRGFMGTLHFLCQSHRFIVRGWLLFFGSLYFQINGVLYFKCSWIGTEDNFPSLFSPLYQLMVFISSYEALLLKLLNAFAGLWDSYSYFIPGRQGGLTLHSVFFIYFSFIS